MRKCKCKGILGQREKKNKRSVCILKVFLANKDHISHMQGKETLIAPAEPPPCLLPCFGSLGILSGRNPTYLCLLKTNNFVQWNSKS